jgi:L-fuconolactonase
MSVAANALSRRSFLAHSAALIAASGGHGPLLAADQPKAHPGCPVIDTHTHFYDPTRPEGVPWPGKGDPVLYRPVLPAEFFALTESLGVVETVVVEASPWFEDNAWLLGLAKQETRLTGIVGNLTPGTPEFAGRVRELARNPRYRGFRINQGLLAKNLGEQAFLRDLAVVAELGLVLDVNGGPDLPADVARLARAVPNLTIAINHLANVKHDGKAVPKEWREGMAAAAACEHVWVKVSALVEGVSGQKGAIPNDAAFYRPALDTVWELFGEKRLVYGSDWPVSARFAPYETVQQIVRDYFATKGKEATRLYFADNARRLYRPVSL